MHKLGMTIDDVRRAFQRPLPGLAAQLRMSPPYRERMIVELIAHAPVCKQAGVLILLYPSNGQLCFPLTRRQESVEHHKGQISLPGGSREGDESLRQAALRETQEEIGVDAAAIEVLGNLTPLFVPPSNFYVQPFVGYVPCQPEFHIETDEVAQILKVPLAALLDPTTERAEDWEIRGEIHRIPFYQFGPHKVWGATAMILAEFVAMLGRQPIGEEAGQTPTSGILP